MGIITRFSQDCGNIYKLRFWDLFWFWKYYFFIKRKCLGKSHETNMWRDV